MSISYVKIFNQVTDEFFNELIRTFPEDTKIKVKYTLFQTIVKVNFKKPCIEFMNNVIPHLEKIAMRDEQLFIGKEKPKMMGEVFNIERFWTPELSPITKNAIWKYLQSFITIGINVVEMPPETHNIINYIINFSN